MMSGVGDFGVERPRRAPGPVRFTTADVFKMIETGVLRDDDKVELIYGELVAMNAKKNDHELVKNLLIAHLARSARRELFLAAESTLYLRDDLFVEPDLMLYARGLLPEDVRGRDVALLIEVAEESLRRDLTEKAEICARHGVAEYWVIDAVRRRTTVHLRPTEGRYEDVRAWGPNDTLTPMNAPEAAVRLADLD
jgi:Uma2 family endonuclease